MIQSDVREGGVSEGKGYWKDEWEKLACSANTVGPHYNEPHYNEDPVKMNNI